MVHAVVLKYRWGRHVLRVAINLVHATGVGGWVVSQKDLKSLSGRNWKHVGGTSSGSGGLDHPKEDFVPSDGIARQPGDEKGSTGQRNSTVRVSQGLL